jgi:hypothetical protein
VEPELVREILQYFVSNPHAADGLEGIMRWRLLQERLHHRLEETREAVDWLVARGYLLQDDSPLSGPIFRMNVAEREEIERLLRKDRGRPHSSSRRPHPNREP